MVMRVQENDPRRDTTSADQSQGPKLWSAIQGNILGNSTGKDTHPKGMGQMRIMKYLRESCYHCIECSVANSLAALIRK